MGWTIVDEMNEMNCGLNEIRWNLNNEDDNVTCRERFPHLKPYPLITWVAWDHMIISKFCISSLTRPMANKLGTWQVVDFREEVQHVNA